MAVKIFYVAHNFATDGQLTFTKGGFETVADAQAEAEDRNENLHGGWWVVRTTPYNWLGWVNSDHSRPVDGTTIATGGFFAEADAA